MNMYVGRLEQVMLAQGTPMPITQICAITGLTVAAAYAILNVGKEQGRFGESQGGWIAIRASLATGTTPALPGPLSHVGSCECGAPGVTVRDGKPLCERHHRERLDAILGIK
jgi:hypothetical protein